jgi:OHCU decarboxylase
MNGLERLNSLSSDTAEAEMLKCCGSRSWARRMVQLRPFQDFKTIEDAADKIWWELEEQDWLEAFSSHPKIGEKRAAVPQQGTQKWSEQEQSGTLGAGDETMRSLAHANRAYENRFGYIFIVCATGKTAAEMLAIVQGRLQNDPATELRIAAAQQAKITQIRLRKLLEE